MNSSHMDWRRPLPSAMRTRCCRSVSRTGWFRRYRQISPMYCTIYSGGEKHNIQWKVESIFQVFKSDSQRGNNITLLNYIDRNHQDIMLCLQCSCIWHSHPRNVRQRTSSWWPQSCRVLGTGPFPQYFLRTQHIMCQGTRTEIVIMKNNAEIRVSFRWGGLSVLTHSGALLVVGTTWLSSNCDPVLFN